MPIRLDELSADDTTLKFMFRGDKAGLDLLEKQLKGEGVFTTEAYTSFTTGSELGVSIDYSSRFGAPIMEGGHVRPTEDVRADQFIRAMNVLEADLDVAKVKYINPFLDFSTDVREVPPSVDVPGDHIVGCAMLGISAKPSTKLDLPLAHRREWLKQFAEGFKPYAHTNHFKTEDTTAAYLGTEVRLEDHKVGSEKTVRLMICNTDETHVMNKGGMEALARQRGKALAQSIPTLDLSANGFPPVG